MALAPAAPVSSSGTAAAETTSSSAPTAPATTSSSAVPAVPAHAWEDTSSGHAWEAAVREDEHGNIIVDSDRQSLQAALRARRRRLEQNDTAQRNLRVVRDLLRYVVIVLDASRWMRQKDAVLGGSSRLEATVNLLHDFVAEFYDQNPLSHLGIVVCHNAEAEILTPLAPSRSKTHQHALSRFLRKAQGEPPYRGGEFSIQNGVEVAGRSLGHLPRYGSREIVVLTAALSTCDPGFVLTSTLPSLQNARIRVSCLALSAEMYICRKLTQETNGAMGVVLDRQHFRDWLWQQCVPPPHAHAHPASGTGDEDDDFVCDMVRMGFPTRTTAAGGGATLVHSSENKTVLAQTAYTCPQCQAANQHLPTDCAVCGLKLVLSPHLARSFHHLFPVVPFQQVIPDDSDRQEDRGAILPTSSAQVVSSMPSATTSGASQSQGRMALDSALLVSSKDNDTCCYACLRPLQVASSSSSQPQDNSNKKDEPLWLRFQCPECHNFFCVDCDVYLHESLHNCPGCLSK